MLEAAGLTAVEEAVYRLLITNSTASADEVASQTGLTSGQAEGVLAALATMGLASPTDRQPSHFTASPPDVALLPRLQRNADALDQARAAVTDLLESYRGTRRRGDADQLIEVITGAEALRQNLRQLQENARHEMLWFCKAEYVAMPSGSNRSEYEALDRGVRYRVLYERAFFDDDGAVDNVVEAVGAGEVARSVPHLPLRLAVADRSIAICPLVPGGPSGSPIEPTAALLRDSSLLEALTALFERYWEDAVPLHVSGVGAVDVTKEAHGTGTLRETDRRLLSLLVAGVTDKAIASHMGLSRRTVQRHIHQMMTLAGATTRMQLAWQAARRGWL
ncbi:helix-turn-helix domain-containing protein [Streptomyces sp. NBC_00887]|uniref:helix-turn-helix domain-containing protein n=1 Tax=Streptomyces sp. NBC_00887 TaxID=2975859 RepID=UPI003867D756|nr:LuxR C-terminal-related transcriptional regulator [Streptomyces sp. NBC_00887]WSY36223.1 LuxR C-terminal-related transcriptional regulator [Streptomyces sp. NBC_00887]